MDFVERLPASRGRTAIMVVVDRFSKFAHFIPLQHPFIAPKIAQVFFEEIFSLYGLPKSIVSDRDRIFLSSFWTELFKLQGTQLHMSSSYHPQSDGQTERVNQCLECYLRCFCGFKPKEWCKWIPWATFWYNTTWKSATGFIPFKVVYGRPPLTLQYVPKTAKVQSMEGLLYDRDRVRKILLDNLTKAQNRMKFFADRHRTDRKFEVGDLVLLKLQPYKQTSVRGVMPQKLSTKYYGPYTVIEKIGKLAYRLQLLPSARIHNVFHVSQLKRYEGKTVTVQFDPPSFWKKEPAKPESIVERRIVRKGNKAAAQWLIKWKGEDITEATWEDAQSICEKFPQIDLADEVILKGGGVSGSRAHSLAEPQDSPLANG